MLHFRQSANLFCYYFEYSTLKLLILHTHQFSKMVNDVVKDYG